MAKAYINAANQGVYEVDHINRVFDIPEHDASAKGLKLGGTLVTATAAELNKVDGIASTTAEIDQRSLSFTMTLGTANSDFIVIPYACTVTTVYTVITAAIATGDEVLTLKNNAGSAMANGTITITQSGSAAGDIDSASPTTNNTFTAGQKLEIATAGASDGGEAIITVLCTIT